MVDCYLVNRVVFLDHNHFVAEIEEHGVDVVVVDYQVLHWLFLHLEEFLEFGESEFAVFVGYLARVHGDEWVLFLRLGDLLLFIVEENVAVVLGARRDDVDFEGRRGVVVDGLDDLGLPALEAENVDEGVVVLEQTVVANELDPLDLLSTSVEEFFHQGVGLGVQNVQLNVIIPTKQYKLF